MVDIANISSITNFQAALKEGLIRSSRFIAIVIPPIYMAGFYPINLPFLCPVAKLPGKYFDTTESRTFGPIRKVAYDGNYSDGMQLTFLCTGAFAERLFFDAWQAYIQDPTDNYMGYYNDYVGSIVVVQYNDKDVPIYGIVCSEAWPRSVQAQNLDWSSGDFQKLTVDFAIHNWYSAEQGIMDIVREVGGMGGDVGNYVRKVIGTGVGIPVSLSSPIGDLAGKGPYNTEDLIT